MRNVIVGLFAFLSFGCSTSDDKPSTDVVPLAPTELIGSFSNSTQVTFAWTDNSTNETGFKIERKTGNENYVQIATVGSDITNYSDIDLIANTTYIYRVLAYNLVGNSLTYTNQITIKTPALVTIPTVTTNDISFITISSALGGGNVTSDGGSTVIARGVVWSTSPNPTIELTTKTPSGTGIGAFICDIGGLKQNTTYFVRAYATNSVGTSYGNEISFVTQLQNSLVLIKNINTINSNGDIDTSLIKYEGNKIISMNNTDGDYAYKINYYYTGNLITRREESNGTIINYTYENNKLKTSIETHSNSDGTTAKTKKVYTYSSNGTISITETYFDPKTNVETLGITCMLTFKDNNLVKYEEFHGDYISAIDIEYDTKNNPFNNVLGLNLLLEVDVTIFSSNNILKWTNTQKKSGIITQSSTTSYTYTYDANGYPIAHNRYSEGKSIETGQYLY